MVATMYVFDDETMECLQVVTGGRAELDDYTTGLLEQHGYLSTFSPNGLRGVTEAEKVTLL